MKRSMQGGMVGFAFLTFDFCCNSLILPSILHFRPTKIIIFMGSRFPNLFDCQAQAMKEQAQLREEMAYQYKLGNFEVTMTDS